MKKLYYLFAAAAVSLLSFTVTAQENNFYIDAQLRARGEWRNGVLDPGAENTKHGSFINERARLALGYSTSWLELKFAGQHTGVWGQTAQNPVNNGDFNINEAWARLKFGGKKSFYFQFGRQTLIYDDERILGGLDWHIAGRSHDLAKIGYLSSDKKHQIDAVFAFNQNSPKGAGGTYFAAGGQPYKNMETVWYHINTGDKTPVGLSFLFMNLGFEDGSQANPLTRYMQTMGTYITVKPANWTLEGSFYYQCGKAGYDLKKSAWMFALKATAKCNSVWSTTLGLDWLSGQNDSDKSTAFDPLYRTHHKFYGLIDYWYVNRSSSAPKLGLIDPYITLSANASKSLNMALTYHAFMNASDGGIEAMGKGKYQASEIDLQFTWKAMKYVTFMGGYSGFFGGSNFYKPLENCNKTQNWCWLQININPRIFSTNW